MPLQLELYIDALHGGRACTLLGCIAILLAGIPFIFFKYGKKLRSMSKLVSEISPVSVTAAPNAS